MPVQGIDISKYQGDIDWARVREGRNPLRLPEGLRRRRPRRQPLLRELGGGGGRRRPARRLSLHVLVPHRERAGGLVQRRPCRRIATQLPPVLDLEWNNASVTCPKRVPRDDALEKIHKMLEIMEYHTGKRPVIYTDINFHRDVLEGRVHAATSSGCEASPPSRTSASATARGRSGNIPRPAASPASAATSTATPSTAPKATGSAGCRATASAAEPSRLARPGCMT